MLEKDNLFELKFLREERHLSLPNLTSLVLIKEIHDILYQYLVSAEKERLLNAFLDRLKAHVAREREGYGNGPFSIRIDELQFLENEGLQELKYMNWVEVPVYVMEIKPKYDPEDERYPEYEETLNYVLEELLIYNWAPEPNIIYAYPQGNI